MKHIVFAEQPTYSVAILIKETALSKQKLLDYYINDMDLPKEDVVCLSLPYKDGKVSAQNGKKYLDTLLPVLKNLGVTKLLVADGNYFKFITGIRKKLDPLLGYVIKGKYKGYEELDTIYCYNYGSVIHNPNNKEKIKRSIESLNKLIAGVYKPPGSSIIHHAEYPVLKSEIKAFLEKISSFPILVCDVETTGLKHWEAELVYVGFAWSKHEGGCFPYFTALKSLLVDFFINYKGKLLFHNATYDIKVLTYQLFLGRQSTSEYYYAAQKEAVKLLTSKSECTMNIAYLATNNAVQNSLSLKDLAQEFAGDWAEDTTKMSQLASLKAKEYCLKDCLATFFVYEKYYPIMVKDNQLDVYTKMFRPALELIINAELNGMPMDEAKVYNLDFLLKEEIQSLSKKIQNYPLIQEYNSFLQNKIYIQENLLLKTKVKPLEDFADHVFNVDSPNKKTELLHTLWKFPINSLTKKGNPETGGEALEGHLAALMRKHSISDDELL